MHRDDAGGRIVPHVTCVCDLCLRQYPVKPENRVFSHAAGVRIRQRARRTPSFRFFSPMGRETRNQRRSRRRAETRSDRDAATRARLLQEMGVSPPILVFLHWMPCRRMVGYVYNDARFSNGTAVCTSELIHNDCRYADSDNMWIARTPHSTYRVYPLTSAWVRVGASSPINRLKYKLWPKMLMIALLLKVRESQCAPGGIVFYECARRFDFLKLQRD